MLLYLTIVVVIIIGLVAYKVFVPAPAPVMAPSVPRAQSASTSTSTPAPTPTSAPAPVVAPPTQIVSSLPPDTVYATAVSSGSKTLVCGPGTFRYNIPSNVLFNGVQYEVYGCYKCPDGYIGDPNTRSCKK